MGSSDSKDTKKDDGGSDDGCIGNRRVRTIIIAAIIITFFVFGLARMAEREETARDAADAYEEGCKAFEALGITCPSSSATDAIVPVANAWAFVIAGAAISMIGCISAVVLFFIPGCDDKLGRIAGLVLVVGGVVYMIGWIWLIAANRDGLDDFWDAYPDDYKERIQANSAAAFGEALMVGGSTILLGIDALFQIYDNEAFRLSSNLGIILVVSCMCMPSYYLQACDEDDDITCVESDGVEAIATGYLVLIWATAIYIVLYIFTCCTCNCKDNCLVRVGIAVALVVGGVVAAIGYYAKSGGIEDADVDDDSDPAGKEVAYWIGYTILIGGMCVVWALDIALDDVKNRDTKK